MTPSDEAPDRSNKPTVQIAADVGDVELEMRVRRLQRRDINRVWELLKRVFRDVNRETVEYQRPRHKKHFVESFEQEGIEQLVFEAKRGTKYELIGYAEYAYEIVDADSWMNHRYFARRSMRPLFVEEIAVHPDYHGMGVGSFMFEQIDCAAVPTLSSRSPKTTLRRCASIASGISRSSMPQFFCLANSKRAAIYWGRANSNGARIPRSSCRVRRSLFSFWHFMDQSESLAPCPTPDHQTGDKCEAYRESDPDAEPADLEWKG
jgi:GNAT superfamily N-acetyltransferase